MAQYIDKDALVSKIKKAIKNIYAGREYVGIPYDEEYIVSGLQKAEDIINTLEVKEADLEKYLKEDIEDAYIDSLQEEPVSEDLEQAIDNYLATYWGGEKEKQDWLFLKKMAIHFAKWQKKQDQETIELAEDHAMLAGMVKGKEDTVGKVRSILNKVAYRNNGLDVNGDYCEQPYVELDNEFKKLLEED